MPCHVAESLVGRSSTRKRPFAVLALTFISRRIQPSLSLVDHEVEFWNFVHPRINLGKNSVRVTAPRFELTSQRQKVSRLTTEPPGQPAKARTIRVDRGCSRYGGRRFDEPF